MALGADGFDELVTSTLQKIDKGVLFDQVTTKHPTLDWLRSQEKSATGRELVVNLELAEDASTQWTDDSGTFSTAVSDEILGSAVYEWSDPLVSSIRLRYKRLKKNQGRQQVLNLLQTHINSMIKAHRKAIVQAAHARADLDSANSDGTQPIIDGQFHSLDQLFGDADYDADPKGDSSNDNAFDVGGIDSSSQDHWQATRLEHTSDDGDADFIDIRKAFRKVSNELFVATDSGHSVDKVIAGQDVFEELEDSFYDVAEVRQDPDKSKGQTHFPTIRHGKLEIRLDPDAPPKRAYFLDNDAVDLYALAGTFMEREPTQFVPGNLDRVTPVATILSNTTNQRRALGLLLRPDSDGGDA